MRHYFTISFLDNVQSSSLQRRQPLISDTAYKKVPLKVFKHRSCFSWVHWSALSSGGLDLIGWLGVEVLPDGVVVYGGAHGHKQVPDGVSKWDDAVTFEKDHPQTVAGSAHQQLAQPWLLRLGRKAGITGILTGKWPECDGNIFDLGPQFM